MKFFSLSLALLMLLLFSNCGNVLSDNNSTPHSITEESIKQIDSLELIHNTCFSCHNPNLEIDNRLAPPMFKVREHYLTDSITKKEFVESVWNFVRNPSEELSIMPGAVRNFSLMPKQNFKEEDVKIIASYLFDNDVSSDSWYSKWDSVSKKRNK